jgi:pyrimidine operon attenuation protein/uracil phosphoribosyltransferase
MPTAAATSLPDPGMLIQLLDAAAIQEALRRMAGEIVERNAGNLDKLALVGIYTRGVEVARRLSALVEEIGGVKPEFGVLDISMHRDDLRRRARLASIQPTRLPINLDIRTVVLADDVFFTGRTVRSAMDALGEFGRPPCIQLAALVDRGHRELPIRPDFVGLEIATAFEDRVTARFAPLDEGPEAVWLETRRQP